MKSSFPKSNQFYKNQKIQLVKSSNLFIKTISNKKILNSQSFRNQPKRKLKFSQNRKIFILLAQFKTTKQTKKQVAHTFQKKKTLKTLSININTSSSKINLSISGQGSLNILRSFIESNSEKSYNFSIFKN
jgi:hypothetical protein